MGNNKHNNQMNLKAKIEVWKAKYSFFICVNCLDSKRLDKIVRIEISSDNRMLRTWLCEKCFKRLFKYDNWK